MALGNADSAFMLIEEAFEDRDDLIPVFGTNRYRALLEHDGRYVEVLRRIGLD